MKWFRFYDEVVSDPKAQQLPPALFKHWVNLLCVANRTTPRGTFPDMAAIAFHLRVSESKAKSLVNELHDFGLIDVDADGTLRPHNWGGRQRMSDDVAKRVERYRSNGSVTLHETETERSLTGASLHAGQNRTEQIQSREGHTPRADGQTLAELNGETTPILDMFAAYAAGAGIGNGTSEWHTRQLADLPALRTAVHAGLDPGKLDRMTRYVAATWLAKGITVTPEVGKVLKAESEFDRWEEAGCPAATARAPNGHRAERPTHMDPARAMAEKARLLEAQGL